MTTTEITTDADAKIAAESHRLTGLVAELRHVHGDPVVEAEDMIVFSDTHGHELNEIAAEIDGVSRDEVSEWMHEMARTQLDRDVMGGDAWSVADPVVVLPSDETED